MLPRSRYIARHIATSSNQTPGSSRPSRFTDGPIHDAQDGAIGFMWPFTACVTSPRNNSVAW